LAIIINDGLRYLEFYCFTRIVTFELPGAAVRMAGSVAANPNLSGDRHWLLRRFPRSLGRSFGRPCRHLEPDCQSSPAPGSYI